MFPQSRLVLLKLFLFCVVPLTQVIAEEINYSNPQKILSQQLMIWKDKIKSEALVDERILKNSIPMTVQLSPSQTINFRYYYEKGKEFYISNELSEMYQNQVKLYSACDGAGLTAKLTAMSACYSTYQFTCLPSSALCTVWAPVCVGACTAALVGCLAISNTICQ